MRAVGIFKVLRFFLVAAIILTVGLTIFMLVESATPGTESARQSGALAGLIKDSFDVSEGVGEVATERVSVSLMTGCTGESLALKASFYPKNATDTDVEWFVRGSSNDEPSKDCAVACVNDDNTLTFKQYGAATLIVRLKSDPTVEATTEVHCYGTAPNDIVTLTPTKTAFKEGDNSALYYADQDGRTVSLHRLQAESSDPSVASVGSARIAAKKAGTTTITVKKDDKIFCSYTITVTENKNFVAPSEIKLKNEDISLPVGTQINIDTSLFDVLPSGAQKGFNYSISVKNPSGKSVVTRVGDHSIEVLAAGDATVTIASSFDSSRRANLTVHGIVPKPDSMRVIGKTRIAVDDEYSFYAFGGGNYIDNVEWTVLKGDVDILGGGKFRAKRLGKIKLRATYIGDDSLYADIEVTVSLYENFGLFVRKVIGHFLMFAALGLGVSAIFVLGMKRKGLGTLIALALSLGLAMMSECLQMPIFTEGRYASWTDVGIDYFGALCGIAVTLLALAIYKLIERLSPARASYKAAMGALTFKTAFRSAKKLRVFDSSVYSAPADGAINASTSNHALDDSPADATLASSSSDGSSAVSIGETPGENSGPSVENGSDDSSSAISDSALPSAACDRDDSPTN